MTGWREGWERVEIDLELDLRNFEISIQFRVSVSRIGPSQLSELRWHHHISYGHPHRCYRVKPKISR